MRPLAKPAIAVAATALLATATACGSANVLQGLSPKQMVTLASSKVTGQSYRMAVDGTVSIDVSGVRGLSAAELQMMAGALQNFRLTGSGDVQNSQRLRLAMTLALPTLGDKHFVAVAYDGHYYMSFNGGKSFADVGTLGLQGVATTPDDIKTLLDGAAGVKDLGTTIHDGERVEHLRATLGQDYYNRFFDKFSGSTLGAMQEVGALIKQVVSISGSTLDVYVRTLDGRVEATETHATMSLDMGRFIEALTHEFGGRIPSGSGAGSITGAMVIAVSGTNRFTDYGARITVSKPTVDPNAPTLPGIFGNGSGA